MWPDNDLASQFNARRINGHAPSPWLDADTDRVSYSSVLHGASLDLNQNLRNAGDGYRDELRSEHSKSACSPFRATTGGLVGIFLLGAGGEELLEGVEFDNPRAAVWGPLMGGLGLRLLYDFGHCKSFTPEGQLSEPVRCLLFGTRLRDFFEESSLFQEAFRHVPTVVFERLSHADQTQERRLGSIRGRATGRDSYRFLRHENKSCEGGEELPEGVHFDKAHADTGRRFEGMLISLGGINLV